MPASLNEIYKMVGSLQSDVTNLTRLIEAQDSRSTESRKRVYDRLESLSDTVGTIDDRVSSTERVIKEIEPLARDFGVVREKSKTVFALIVAMWTLLGGFLMWMGNNILEWVTQRLTGS